MPPAQALPGADEEITPKSAVIPITEKANGNLMCANNCEDNLFHAEPSGGKMKAKDDDAEDEEVDVLECDGGGRPVVVKDDNPEATETEHSSSFGDTFSGSGGNPSDAEVDSWDAVDNGGSFLLDGSNKFLKKKKVTDHWRKFIRPIMWRCQWLELRMKELHSQALRYDKELEAYKHEKQLQSKVVRLDNSASRSVPLARSLKKQAMRRQKRKRNEDIVDASSYMCNHNVFSHYENKKPETDVQSVDDDCGDQDENVNDNLEWSVLRFRRTDTSLEQILLEIESTQSRVLKLRSQLNEVTCRYAIEISSTPGSFLPGDLQVSCPQSPSFSAGNDGDATQPDALNTPTHNQSEYEREDTILPGSTVSSYGDSADELNITMDLFSAADIPLNQPEIAGLIQDAGENVLIDNQAAEDGLQNFEKISHAVEKPQDLVKEESESSEEEANTTPEVSIPEPSIGSEKPDMQQALVLKPCYTGKKRGRKPKKRRRGGSVGPSGEASERVQRRRLG